VVSQNAQVTIVSATPPSITTQPQAPPPLTAGQSATLSVAAAGTAPLSYQWYSGPGTQQPLVGQTTANVTIGPIYATTQVWVRVSNAAGSADSTLVALSVPLATPANVVATATSTSSVTVQWSPVSGADHYEVRRRTASGSVSITTAGSPLTDNSAPPASTLLYDVRAVDASGASVSSYSAPDVATTVVFSTVAQRGLINYAHVSELLDALNRLRALGGSPAVMWSDILPAGVPAPAQHGTIKAAHLSALRAATDQALNALGVSYRPYTDGDLTNALIRAIDFLELQGRSR
jgi:hypothetical protein